MSTALVRAEAAQVMAHHARTFRLAAWFLPAEHRADAAVLYALCREIDDLADEHADETGLTRIQAEISGDLPPRPLVQTYHQLRDRVGLTDQPMLDLIKGARSDLSEVHIQTDDELLTYCYRVAGTVGLMMSPVIGVSEPDAVGPAVDLGIAMQITNICRDVAEDAERGRVYLPEARLRQAGTSGEALLSHPDREATSAVVLDLLDLADTYYARGEQGMKYIPLRARFAILAASRIYRLIGVWLRSRGGDALAGRTVVPWHGKVGGLLGAAWSVATARP